MLLHFSLTINLSNSLSFSKYIIHLPDDLYLVYFITVISYYVKFREGTQISFLGSIHINLSSSEQSIDYLN